MNRRLTYKQSGVNISSAEKVTSKIAKLAHLTFNSNVLTEIGSFGGLFAFQKNKWKDPVLVSSTDGVGTKVIIASLADRIEITGEDLVNHCVNDILVQGAEPLFFLDYIAFPKFSEKIVEKIISGLSKACRENNCVLIGGETAEMPGVYNEGYYDLAGTIVGAVDKKYIIDGSSISPGDVLVGLQSSGLHTNGFSLVRHVFFKGLNEKEKRKILNKKIYSSKTLADILLVPHRSYLKQVQLLLKNSIKISGMAHITGGGFKGNIIRILPHGIRAVVDTKRWTPMEIFDIISKKGNVDKKEMYRVFNMGIGLVIVIKEKFLQKTLTLLKNEKETPFVIGHVEKNKGEPDVIMLW